MADNQALTDINAADIYGPNKVTAFIGPSGCGKSTLRCGPSTACTTSIPRQRAEGRGACSTATNILALEGQDLNAAALASIGMVFQKPTPFPMSIYDNIAFGIQLYENAAASAELNERVEIGAQARRRSGTRSRTSSARAGSGLSGGQQQRLCIARTVAVKPEVILFDEPCSALDPISTAKVEELFDELKRDYTLVIVTHNMQQAARSSDYTAYMYLGDLIEFGRTQDVFMRPTKKDTEDYITGRFG